MRTAFSITLAVLFIVLMCGTKNIAQDSSSGFLVGAFIASSPNAAYTLYNNYDQILDCGFNSVWQYAKKTDSTNLDQLAQFQYVYTQNDTAPNVPNHIPAPGNIDWISYFTHAKYFRWEAEGDENFPDYIGTSTFVGIKHNNVGHETIDGWSCGEGPQNIGEYFIDGPHYTQYRRYVYTNRWLSNPLIQYNAVFRLKLGIPQEGSFEVAMLKVSVDTGSVDKWGVGEFSIDTLILTTDSLSTNYKEFTISYNYSDLMEECTGCTGQYLPPPGSDWIPLKGLASTPWLDGTKKVRFKVQKLSSAEVIVDYAEVYDRDIWEAYFILDPELLVSRISTYNQGYASLSSLRYYSTQDEPHTWDSFIPIKKVQEILDNLSTDKDLLVHFYPGWNNKREGVQNVLEKWVNIAQPKKLMFWYAPFTCDEDVVPCEPYPREETLNNFHSYVLQPAHLLQKDFYVTLQSWGTVNENTGYYSSYMTPTPAELSAGTMLSLAHGIKGIFYELYYTYESADPWLVEGLVDINFSPDSNWYKVQELASRLKGKLGNTLLTLDYTGDFINMEYQEGPPPEDNEHDYLSIQHYGMSYFWHAGFFQKQNQTDNKHFLLANLRTNMSVESKLIVSNNTDYENVSFKDIEGGNGRVDTTIGYNSSITYYETMPAGEGRLYRVSPVVKYGGRLIYNEEIVSETLYDDMIIENGATLGIYGNYDVDADIIEKDGGRIVNTGNGKITFYNDHKLILQGNSTLSSLTQNKLVLDFVSPTEYNGILADSGLVIIISNCEIKNAGTGITVSSFSSSAPESEDFRFQVDSVDFIGCEEFGINITGQYVNKAMIENSSFTGSAYGVSAVNLDEVVIFNNYFTNTEMGIRLINITKTDVIGNIIISNQYSMQGIFLDNSGGNLRANFVQGHTNGIHLGNSSPDIGSNIIYDNKYHGIYIGIGSLPNMLGGRWIGDPPVFYATSGYNKIYENGGWEEANPPLYNDGSEIFINNANVLLSRGCNEIMDDREPSSPLINTILLMNGINFGLPITVSAEYNIWEVDPFYPLNSLRFGGLTVDYDPYYSEPCPTPDGGGGGESLLSKSSGGEVIDTFYSAEGEPGTLSESEILYSLANESFISGDYESAEIYYNQIISSSDTTENKFEAYSRKYSIGKLMKKSTGYFNNLYNIYSSLSQNTDNELLEKIFKQLSTKSKVGEQQYISAISEYDDILQQNPGTEEAIYAEIDALTTSLLVEGNDSTLGKTAGGRYLVKTTADYTDKINDILRKNFGSKNETEENEILPKEYTLYQNYPNPFNPVTTISYDLPKPGNVKLMIYDILGREVKTLINTQQEAGRYKVNFNASLLASGVYLYRLSINEYVDVKKMILLK